MKTLAELARDSLFSIVFHLAPRLASALLFILIGRRTGPADAGVFALAITYLTIFTAIVRGLDDLVVRQVSREPGRARHYLAVFLRLRIGLSLLSLGVLVVLVLVVFDYADSTAGPVLILASSLVPDGLAYVAQSVLLGQRRFGLPAAALAIASVLKLAIGWTVLLTGGTVQQIAWIWLAGSVLGMVLMLALAIQRVGLGSLSDWTDRQILSHHRRTALSFLLMTALVTLETQADTLFLSGFHGEAEVGRYSAATTIAYSLLMFSQAYRFAVYPLMTRYALQSPDKLSDLYEQSVRYLGTLIMPTVAGIALLSPQIVDLVFGPEFQQTAGVLQVLIPTVLLMFLGEPNVRLMLVRDRQKPVSIFLVASFTTNVLLNALLTPTWGAPGAALARVCSALVFFALSTCYVARRLLRFNVLETMLRPAVATLAMAALVWILRSGPLVVSIGAGVVSYGASLWLVDMLWSKRRRLSSGGRH